MGFQTVLKQLLILDQEPPQGIVNPTSPVNSGTHYNDSSFINL